MVEFLIFSYEELRENLKSSYTSVVDVAKFLPLSFLKADRISSFKRGKTVNFRNQTMTKTE